MKKIINKPENVVDEMLNGVVAAHPDAVKRVEGFQVLIRANGPLEKVAVVCGGGSGHEPMNGGYVGTGMLDAAIAGDVFTSPTPDQVFEAIRAANGGKGVLLVVLNYTGDIMNFEMAAEMAAEEGIRVETVIVNDDVAVEDSTWTTGRRGIAGTIMVNKIAGAKAEICDDLLEVKRVTNKAITNIKSMGMSMSSCTVPAAGKPSFFLGDDEVEIGLGIHGEPGIIRETIKPADETVDILLSKILPELNLVANDEVAVMINGLGATPGMELYIANLRVAKVLAEKGVKVAKTYVGNYVTSLDMAGFSITVLKLDAELKELLLAPVNTPALMQF